MDGSVDESCHQVVYGSIRGLLTHCTVDGSVDGSVDESSHQVVYGSITGLLTHCTVDGSGGWVCG